MSFTWDVAIPAELRGISNKNETVKAEGEGYGIGYRILQTGGSVCHFYDVLRAFSVDRVGINANREALGKVYVEVQKNVTAVDRKVGENNREINRIKAVSLAELKKEDKVLDSKILLVDLRINGLKDLVKVKMATEEHDRKSVDADLQEQVSKLSRLCEEMLKRLESVESQIDGGIIKKLELVEWQLANHEKRIKRLEQSCLQPLDASKQEEPNASPNG